MQAAEPVLTEDIRAKARKIRIELPKSLYTEQKQILDHPGSLAVFGGRGVGKTAGGCKRIMKWVVEKPDLYWWVGLDWRSASMREAWEFLSGVCRDMWTQCDEDPKNWINEGKFTLKWPNGAEIWMRTAERPEGIAGKQIAGAVGDEWSMWAKRVWDEFLRATLLVKRGWVCFIGVPKGDHWSSDLWKAVAAGMENPEKEKYLGWLALRIETIQNPLVDPATLAEIASTTETWLYDQEYRGMIVAGVGRPFEGMRELVMPGKLELPFDDAKTYFCGVDCAGGGADEMTLAICHKEDDGIIVQDALRATILTSPEGTVAEWASLCKSYGIKSVKGDAYAGNWPSSMFKKYGIGYIENDRTASDTYKELIPIVRQKRIRVIDDKVQTEQFLTLLHKQTPGGDSKVTHVPTDHDDRANATAIAALDAHERVVLKFNDKVNYTSQPRESAASGFAEQTDFLGRRSAYRRGFGR